MMNKLSKLFIVAILLAAYFSVYITDFLCNFEHGFVQLSQQHLNKGGHDHHNDTSKPHQTHNHIGSHSHDNNSDDDNCCKDLTYSFIYDLSKLISPTLELKSKIFNAPFCIHYIDVPEYEYFPSQFMAYQYNLPPPKIPNIRIFIQSFII
jgi:hypothetical protein